MAARSATILTLSRVGAVLLLILLVLVNVVLGRTASRMDMTEEHLFTLDPGTRKIAAGLEDPALIRVFWGGLPPTAEPLRRKYAALLDELAQASEGKVTVEWIDTEEKAGAEAAQEAKAQEFTYVAQVGSRQQAQKGYSTLVVEAGSAEPQLLNELTRFDREFEYQVATALVRATKKTKDVLAFVDGSGGGPMGGGRGSLFDGLKAQLQKRHGDAVQYWHTLDKPLAENITTLVLVAPTSLSEVQIYHLEQYLLRGGKAVVLLDRNRWEAIVGKPYGDPDPTGLETWLQQLGITAGTGVALETDPRLWQLYPVWSEPGRPPLFRESGYWFVVLPENLDRDHPALSGLEGLSIFWPTPFSVDQELQAAAGRKVTVLASTSEKGARSDDMSALREGETPRGLPREKVPLALLVEGPVTSMWKGKPVPGEAAPADAPGGLPGLPGVPPLDAPKEPAPAPAPADAPKEPAPAPAPADAPKEPAPADAPKEPAPAPAPADAPKEPAPAPAPSEPAGPKGEEGAQPAPGQPAPGQPAPGQPAPGQPAPVPPVPAAPAPAGEAKPEAPAGPKRLEQGAVRLVLLGDSDFTNNILGQRNGTTQQLGLGTGGNALVLNSIDWLMGDDALLSLRGKDAKARTIEEVDDGKRELLMWLTLGAVPVFMLCVGVIVFLMRQSQR